MLKRLNRSLVIASLGLLATSLAFAGETPKTKKEKRASRINAPVQIKVVPIGPTQEQVDQTRNAVERSEAVQKLLSGTSYRIMSFEYVDRDSKTTVGKFEPQQFRVIFYDYTNDRTLIAEGSFSAPENVRVTEDARKPFPNYEELEDAQNMVSRDPRFAADVKEQRIRIFEAMPPITLDPQTGERLVNVGIESLDNGTTRNEVVSVSFKRGVVIRYENNAPPTSSATDAACGIPTAGQGSTSNGTAGQYQMTVTQNGTTLWEFLVLRPSISSGNFGERSGIELRDDRYRGKMIMKRGHAPVLNVQYVDNACGPYRDWQYQEGFFNAPDAGAQDVAPGIRILAPGQMATTALESGNDAGNFKGVAIYTQDNETVMVSEMNAGWYRYIMEWRLANDGTIRPRYGYGATVNSCVCAIHTHHTYWRFDFDVVNANNKLFQVERGRKFMTPLLTEAKFFRRLQTNRSLLVQNGSGNEAVMLVPNLNDGNADTYGDSDFWVLRYRDNGGQPGELDDPNTSTAIRLDPWINGESLDNQDLVIWYGAHFIHADGNNLLNPDRSGRMVLSGSHVVGPDIRLIRW